jgi:LacI family transcriptional regulator
MKTQSAKESRAKPAGISKPPAQRSRARIQDVASWAGVSLGTVSAVLNSNGRIGEDTRARVQEAIAALGYRPDLYASNMARRQTQVLGLIVSNLQNPFFAETAQAIEEEAAEHGYQISLMATNFRPEQLREAVKRLLGSRLAGLAVLTSEHDEASRQLVLASGLPSVFLDVGAPADRLSILRVDSRHGMQAAVNHLIELGHRQLIYVKNSQHKGRQKLLSHRLRDQGFASAIRAFKAKGISASGRCSRTRSRRGTGGDLNCVREGEVYRGNCDHGSGCDGCLSWFTVTRIEDS